MKKLSLDLESIDVESFPTAEEKMGVGTVQGHITLYCSDPTCDDCNSMACDSKYHCAATVEGLTCMYETCGACNPTNPPDCTTYCP
ncbi:MAG TPA: hypothetical protein VF705_10635 [Longimicrobium sp.]|jgi:hypothetical protein